MKNLGMFGYLAIPAALIALTGCGHYKRPAEKSADEPGQLPEPVVEPVSEALRFETDPRIATVRLSKDESEAFTVHLSSADDAFAETSITCSDDPVAARAEAKDAKGEFTNRIILANGSKIVLERETEANAVDTRRYVAVICDTKSNLTGINVADDVEAKEILQNNYISEHLRLSPKDSSSVETSIACRATSTDRLEAEKHDGIAVNRITLIAGSNALVQRDLDVAIDGNTGRELKAKPFVYLSCPLKEQAPLPSAGPSTTPGASNGAAI